MQQVFGPNRDWVYVDVGANKGYAVGAMLSLLIMDDNNKNNTLWNPAAIFANVKRKMFRPSTEQHRRRRDLADGQALNSLCGGCCECQENILPLTNKALAAKSLRIFAIDLSYGCFQFIREQFGEDVLPSHVSVNALNVGVSHKTGRAETVLGECNEHNSLTAQNSENSSAIEIKPLIELLPEGTHIDFLSTDTEGFDGNVFYGSRELFVSRRVSVYMFESGAFPADPRYTTLRGIIADLDSLGYDCYTPFDAPEARERAQGGRPLLGRITGCSEPVVENLIGWRNVLCYGRWNKTLQQVFCEMLMRNHTAERRTCVRYNRNKGYDRYALRVKGSKGREKVLRRLW